MAIIGGILHFQTHPVVVLPMFFTSKARGRLFPATGLPPAGGGGFPSLRAYLRHGGSPAALRGPLARDDRWHPAELAGAEDGSGWDGRSTTSNNGVGMKIFQDGGLICNGDIQPTRLYLDKFGFIYI